MIEFKNISGKTEQLPDEWSGTIAFNCDCMELMRNLPDKYFGLCIADPPYGIKKSVGATSRQKRYGQMSTVNDLRFTSECFEELKRVSEHQIIFGYNHLSDILPPTTEFVFWYKHQPVDTYADGELAWTDFNKTAKCYDYPYFGSTGADNDGRIHPAQKPIELYRWLYNAFLHRCENKRIFDPFLGSGSSRIAAHDFGYDFVGCEIEEEFFKREEKRYEAYSTQESLFLMGDQIGMEDLK